LPKHNRFLIGRDFGATSIVIGFALLLNVLPTIFIIGHDGQRNHILNTRHSYLVLLFDSVQGFNVHLGRIVVVMGCSIAFVLGASTGGLATQNAH
jgi:hypothetical protein